MIHPKQSNVITLSDLKSCRLASMFLNTFINIEKYLDYEQRDPSAAKVREREMRRGRVR